MRILEEPGPYNTGRTKIITLKLCDDKTNLEAR